MVYAPRTLEELEEQIGVLAISTVRSPSKIPKSCFMAHCFPLLRFVGNPID
jgi:hypothetical protein